MFRTWIAGGLASVLLASTASAHDFFLLPQSFAPGLGEPVVIQATVSAEFPGAGTVVDLGRIRTQDVVAGGRRAPLVIVGTGTDARLSYTGSEPGDAVVAVDIPARHVEYAADRIELILGEYDIGGDVAVAARALPKFEPLKVRSTRFAKTVLCTRACGDRDDLRRATGLDLEFVLAASGSMRFVLLASGQPTPNHPVAVVARDGKRHRLMTDGRGTVALPDGLSGPSMLFAALMTPPTEAGGRFDLRLTTLTLYVGP